MLFDYDSWHASHSGSPMLDGLDFVVVDIETTGLLAEQKDRIVEVAVVELDRKLNVAGEWVSVVNPQRDLGASHIHGVTGQIARDAPPFSEVADDLVHHLAGRVIVGHNVEFDARFIAAEFQRLGLETPELALVDTQTLSDRRSLDEACEAFGISREDAHTALGDALATAELFRRVVRRKFARADVLSDLGCTTQPPGFNAWPSLTYEPTEFRREDAQLSARTSTTVEFEVEAAVCFTGEARLMFDGRPITRVLAGELAEHAGLVVKSGVSKKLSVLVAADLESLSGKAKKARDYQIPIMSHVEFWTSIGVETTPIPEGFEEWAPRPLFGSR